MIRPRHSPDLVALLDAARSGDPLSLFAIADWLHDADPPPVLPRRVPRWLRRAWVGHEPTTRFPLWGYRTRSSPPRPTTVLRDLGSRFGLHRLGLARLAGVPVLACDGGDLRPLAALLQCVRVEDRSSMEYLLPLPGVDLREKPPGPSIVWGRPRHPCGRRRANRR